MLCVICTVGCLQDISSSQSLFTALPTLPLFFPHDLVFNMDAEKLHHTSLFTLQKNKSNHILWYTVARNVQPRLTTVLCWILNIYFLRFYGETSETIRKPTRNGVWQGPRELNNSNTCSKGAWWTCGLTNSCWSGDTLANRRVWLANGAGHKSSDCAIIHVPGVWTSPSVSCTGAWWSNRRNCWKFSGG